MRKGEHCLIRVLIYIYETCMEVLVTSLSNFIHSTYVNLSPFILSAQQVHLPPPPFLAKPPCMGEPRGPCPWSQDGTACMSVSVFSHPNSKYCS